MLYTPLTKRAMKLCFEAHAGQVDKCGIPYVNHPLHLAEQMDSEDEVCVALLHDVMEDCAKTPEDLKAIGLSERAIEALLLLTHGEDVPYLDYVENLKGNTIARKVKVADLRHNSQLARLDAVAERDLERLRKYMEARVVLGDMTYTLETPVGPVSVTVNGEPYPFSVEDESRKGFTHYEEDETDAADRGGIPVSGSPDKTYLIEVDTLPLSVGDEISIVNDFDANMVDRGGREHVDYRVYAKDGYTIGLGFCDDESGSRKPGWCSYRYNCSDNSYAIVEDPIEHRFHRLGHKFGIRIAWKRGTSETDALIVGWVAGF